MEAKRLGDLTIEQLRLLIREEIQRMTGENYESIYTDSDLPDFPVDHWGSWPVDFSDRR